MAFSFCSFSSGSSGNCYLIKNGRTALLVDAGISGKRIIEGLEKTDTAREQVRGLFITHEHEDHIKSVRVLGKKLPEMSTYANEATWEQVEAAKSPGLGPERVELFSTGEDIEPEEFDGISVRAFHISHDAAEPVGYSFSFEGKKVSIVTDTGCITEEIFEEIADADLLVLEANHEPEIVRYCRYPYPVKQRIVSDTGHLSNECAGRCIRRLAQEHPKKRQILLGHLSHENNMPDLARMTISDVLEEEDIYTGGDLKIDVILRDTMSRIYEL